MSNTILLKGSPLRKEAQAAAAITPGHLVELKSTGKIGVHATAGGYAMKAFAVENEVFGNGVDVAYAADDNVLYGVFKNGEEVYALIPAAAAAIVVGDFLTSNGDGTLKKATSTDQRLFQSLEAVDNSAGGSAVRLKIAVL